MNILIPDEWLREYLETTARPVDIRRCLSLCGPSVERINYVNGQPVYDLEITTNRIDAYSVYGVAREAAVILPEFGFPARLLPPKIKTGIGTNLPDFDIQIKNDPELVNRIMAVKLSGFSGQNPPAFIKERLMAVGQRPLSAIIDITNYVMWEIGHPLHAFDYQSIKTKKLIVRLARAGEKFTTLDDRTYRTKGGEIVFDNGRGEIIDLPSIMGTKNTVVTEKTTDVILFTENSDPGRIRTASMQHGIRTQAAVINEKHPDAETAKLAFNRALTLAKSLPGVTQTSAISDISAKEEASPEISVSQDLIDKYLGRSVSPKKITATLTKLGLIVKTGKSAKIPVYRIIPPSWRRDLRIPEDIIEEIARVTGYHAITPLLPNGAPPVVSPDPVLLFEERLKISLKGLGFSEFLTSSLISGEQLEFYGFSVSASYRLKNELTREQRFLRPSLGPGFLAALSQNSRIRQSLAAFELSNVYLTRKGDLPQEVSSLIMAVTKTDYRIFKGRVEAFLKETGADITQTGLKPENLPGYFDASGSIAYPGIGFLGRLDQKTGNYHRLPGVVYLAEFTVAGLFMAAKKQKSFRPVPRFPEAVEDLALIVPSGQWLGPVIDYIRAFNPLIREASLLDLHDQTRTIRVTYGHPERNLTGSEIREVREMLLTGLSDNFGIRLKNI